MDINELTKFLRLSTLATVINLTHDNDSFSDEFKQDIETEFKELIDGIENDCG